MINENDIIRKNIGMSLYVAQWYEEKSKKLGISQSNLMVVALAEYIKQEQAVNIMANFEYVMEQLEDLKAQAEK